MSSSDPVPSPPAPPSVEERLRRAYQQLAFHFDNTPLAVIEWDHEFRVTRWTGQAERVFGWTADEVLGKRPDEWPFVHDADAEMVRRLVTDMVAGRDTRNVAVGRNRTKAGAVIWCEWHNSVLLDETGRMVSCLSLVLDVTERRAAEEQLARSEARLRAAFACAQMLSWDWDLHDGRSYFSGDYAAFYGLPADRDYAVSENAWQAVHPDDVSRIDRTIRRALETGEDLEFEYRGRVPRSDGETRWFVTRGQVLRGPDDKPARVVAVTSDVTDRKLAERERESLDRQLLDAQKWESLGVLAGGVAHDFNNILTVILGSAGLAGRVLPPDSPASPYLEQIEQACRRAAELCRQMLAYAGRGPAPTGRTDLNRLVRDSAPLLEVSASKQTRTRFDLAAGLPAVQADAAQVRQVLLNLVMNAAEAVGEAGGELVVRTRPLRVEAGPADPGYRLPPAPGEYAALVVSDTGPGITDAVRSRMFDPFFTTKFPGRGLGLAAVLGIVRTHRGAIRVDTAPGRGTTVTVLWPPAREGASGAVPPPAPRTQSGTVSAAATRRPAPAPRKAALVIDDEMYVREVAASTLEELGYEPLLAGDGPSGVELFRMHRDAVRVAVIDMVMPGMAGDKVLDELRAVSPTLPAILVSGYTDRRVAARPGARTEFLLKPFHPEDLTAAVLRVVGAPAGR